MNEKDKVIAIEDITRPYITIVVYLTNKKYNYDNQTLLSINNQTFQNYEVLIIGKNIDKKIKNIKKTDKRLKIIEKPLTNLKDIIKHSSKTSKYITILEYGEIINNTYLETNILSLDLNELYGISYTDTYTGKEKKKWNYYFENNILKDYTIPVPNIVIRKNLCKEYENEKVEKIRTWKFFSKIVKEKMGIHQSYYGFLTNKKTSDLSEDNYIDIEREIYSSEILNYPYENYYYDIIKSNINKLKIIPQTKDKTNILLIIPWMVIGGADRFNLEFVKRINHEKYKVTILTDHPKEYVWREEFEKYADEVFEMASFLSRKDIPTFIEYIIKSRKIDIILVTNSMFGYNLIPYIRLKFPKLPIIDYIHCIELYNRDGGYGRDSSMLTSLIDKSLFCSQDAENSCNELFEISKEKTNTVYIGVDCKKFSRDEKEVKKNRTLYQLEGYFTVGYICRIDYQKRPFLLLEIMKKTIIKDNKIKFIIGGAGPLLNNLKQKVEEYNLSNNVLFLGNVSNPRDFYSMCDMTINCSIKEGLALTAYESLSMEVPIISADVGGHKELIDSSCGIIVPLLQKEKDILNFDYQDTEINSYVDGILKIKKNINKYKNNCRNHIIGKFSLEKMISNMEKEISSVIKHPNEEVLKNAIALKNNEKIVYEYLCHYLMGSQYEYQTLINQYRNKFKPVVEEIIKNDEIIEEKKEMIFEKELLLIKDLIKSILKIILFIPRLLLIEMKRIIRKKEKNEEK